MMSAPITGTTHLGQATCPHAQRACPNPNRLSFRRTGARIRFRGGGGKCALMRRAFDARHRGRPRTRGVRFGTILLCYGIEEACLRFEEFGCWHNSVKAVRACSCSCSRVSVCVCVSISQPPHADSRVIICQSQCAQHIA